MSKQPRSASKGPAAGGLQSYELYLGYACNRACRFCFVEKRDRAAFNAPLPYAEICKKLYSAYAKGARSLSLLGGEPTLNKDLERTVRFAKKLGYRMILLFSNGIRLADPAYAKRLADSGISAVNLNIPSRLPGVFERLTRSRGGFPLLLKALENLSALAVPVFAVCVLNRLNYKDLCGYAGFCSGYGIKMFTLQHLKFQGNINSLLCRDNPDIAELKVSMAACAPGIKAMTRYCIKNGLYPPFVEHMAPCVMKNYETRIIDFNQAPSEAEGYLCLHPDGQDVASWDVSYKDRVKVAACASCVYSGRCYGVEKNYLEVFGPGELKALRAPARPYYSGLSATDLGLARASYEEAMGVLMARERIRAAKARGGGRRRRAA
ncbi:MAG TPA: radical SAM protein [Elusimicrobiales bacterium]|nr:radical SAM protein [Elusimicrobiales bacterium]